MMVMMFEVRKTGGHGHEHGIIIRINNNIGQGFSGARGREGGAAHTHSLPVADELRSQHEGAPLHHLYLNNFT